MPIRTMVYDGVSCTKEMKDNLLGNEKEKISMCELLDDIRAEGKAEGGYFCAHITRNAM